MGRALNSLRERLSRTCYQHILPHLDTYQAETDIVKCLPLMEPSIFARFASQACQDATDLVLTAARAQYRHKTRHLTVISHGVRNHAIDEGDEQELLERLSRCLSRFSRDLQEYRSELQRFRQVLAQAAPAAWNNGSAVGEFAFSLFGEGVIGGLLALAGGYAAGNAIERQLQAECERLQQSFQGMLESYDQAMHDLIHYSISVLADYTKSIVSVIRQTCG